MRKCINYTLPEETIARIRKHSVRTMVAQSRIVERAVKEYLDRQDRKAGK